MIDNWSPNWAVTPGEVLLETLEERAISQAELARRMARPLKTISELATGKASITADTAIQLERALGISASVWLALEYRYRETQARERDLASLANETEWLSNFPIADLVRLRIIGDSDAPAVQAGHLLTFFGVSSPNGWERHWGQITAAYRMSRRHRVSQHAVALWLRLAELAGDGTALPPYSPHRLDHIADSLRPLTREIVTAGAVESGRLLLEDAGVGLILVEGISGAPASGAVRWMRGNPWIVLTLRYRTDDQLWFTLFHEIGHLLSSRRGAEVVEESAVVELNGNGEYEANRFARNALIPQHRVDEWLAEGSLDREGIVKLANEAGVSPGIVVGRLERDGLVKVGRFARLKRRL